MELCKSPNIHLISVWDNEEFCGFTLISVRDKSVYVFYVAIVDDKRSKGYGGKILDYLKETNPGRALMLNTEEINEAAANNEQRIRRLKFYERNGFRKMETQMIDDSGVYDILCTAPTFSKEEFMDIVTELQFDYFHVHLSD